MYLVPDPQSEILNPQLTVYLRRRKVDGAIEEEGMSYPLV
jgi:hypothetical protein